MPTAHRIIFMGTPAFALPALKALVEARHEIVAVYTQPPRPAGRGQKDTPSPVHVYAAQQGFDVRTPVSLKHEQLPAADAAVVAAYGLILPKHVLEAPKRGCINIHPSLLPRWRGAAPIQRTLMAGDRETAVCIMRMDEGLDTGGVLGCEPFAIPASMNAGQLYEVMAERGARLLLKVLEQNPSPIAQRTEGITYAAKITEADRRIDWQKSAVLIAGQVRGLSPLPGAFFEHNGVRIKIFEAEAVSASGNPGTVLDDKLTIACGKGALKPLLVQRPGGKRMAVEALLAGQPIPRGTVLL
jgi:methionyl-tRNA formyltransferase